MPGNVKWNGDLFLSIFKAELRRRINVCCIAVQNHAKKLIGVEGAGSAIRNMTSWYGGRKRQIRKKGQVLGHAVSQPGEPPRKQTGRGQASVAHEVGEQLGQIKGRVGTNLGYMRALELGAKAIRNKVFGKYTRPFDWVLLARPWLRRALKEMRGFILRVLAAPMRF